MAETITNSSEKRERFETWARPCQALCRTDRRSRRRAGAGLGPPGLLALPRDSIKRPVLAPVLHTFPRTLMSAAWPRAHALARTELAASLMIPSSAKEDEGKLETQLSLGRQRQGMWWKEQRAGESGCSDSGLGSAIAVWPRVSILASDCGCNKLLTRWLKTQSTDYLTVLKVRSGSHRAKVKALEALIENLLPCSFQLLVASHTPWLVAPFCICKASNGQGPSFLCSATLPLTILPSF